MTAWPADAGVFHLSKQNLKEVNYLYLLLVDNNFISSREIKILLDKNNINCELIKCTSYDAMLDIASKINPDLVMINFDSVANSPVAYMKKLKQSSPNSYILAFIDPVQFGGLHEVIESGIDNYVTKPINREDITLKIRMGLMHSGNMQQTLQFKAEDISPEVPSEASLEETVRDEPASDKLVEESLPVKQQEMAESDKKMFEELADLFGKQFDDSQINYETTTAAEEEISGGTQEELLFSEAESTFNEEEIFEKVTDQPDKGPEEDRNLFDLQVEPEAGFSWPGSGGKDEEIAPGNHEIFGIEPEVRATEALEEDDDLLFGITPEIENISPETIEVTEEKIEEFSLIDEAFSLVESTEPELPAEKADSPIDLPYFDELFSQEPLAEEPIPLDSVNPKQTEEPAFFLASEPVLAEDVPGIDDDDKELFGMVGRERSVDSSSFEELFGAPTEHDKRKKRVAAEPKGTAIRQSKVEYLPFAKKSTANKSTSFPAESVNDQTVAEKSAGKKKVKKSKAVKSKPAARENVPKQANSKLLRVTGNLVTAFLLLIMVTLSFFLIQSRISGGSPAIAGYQIYVVQSGSMSPAFDTGSLVFVKPVDPLGLAEGDIITFSSSGDTTRLTTHRVTGISYEGGLSFITRGDANNVNDPNPVAAENIIGRVTGSVPYLGYIFGFAQTRQGLILLIFVPGLLLIIMELRRLFKYMVESRVEQLKGDAPRKPDDLNQTQTDLDSNKPVIPKGDLTGDLNDFGF